MLPGDSRSAVDARLFDDPRVTTYWDGRRIAGDWLAQHRVGGLAAPGETLWDAFLAFGRDGRWRREPKDVVAAGRPIIAHTSELEQRFEPLLR